MCFPLGNDIIEEVFYFKFSTIEVYIEMRVVIFLNVHVRDVEILHI
jgi:hypothetical protein